MAISLVTRAGNAAPLTATQHDDNLEAIEGAVNTLQDDLADLTTDVETLTATVTDDVALNSQFEGIVTGKQTIHWDNVTNKPTGNTVFCAKKSIADQLVASGSSAVIEFDAEDFDPASVFSLDDDEFVTPADGYYQFNWSAQVELDTGAPTGIGITVSLRVNGTIKEQGVLDLADNTGTRIYKGGKVLFLTTGQAVDLHIDISGTGSADWKVAANGDNTFLSGFLVAAAS